MRLHEQRDNLKSRIKNAYNEIHGLKARIHRKVSMPYGDGSRSDMVNVNSDVLPALELILDILAHDNLDYQPIE